MLTSQPLNNQIEKRKKRGPNSTEPAFECWYMMREAEKQHGEGTVKDAMLQF